ncbi:MAG: DegV family protein, partial [Chloroflexi bacterium]|nr:DegV family protein [Chloroflexota bacterium]
VDKVNPKTSQASPGTFKEVFEKALQTADGVLTIVVSGKLSQTLNSALVAKSELAGAQIEVVDSEATAMALGFIALTCARAAADGASLADLKQLADSLVPRVGVAFVVDTLDYLHRGGRIGGAAKFIGNALSLKPVLHLKDGRVEPLERVRTKKKAVEFMIDHIAKSVEGKGPLRLATLHANAEAEAKELLDSAAARIHPEETLLAEVSPVVGAHTGPGTVGLAWMTG